MFSAVSIPPVYIEETVLLVRKTDKLDFLKNAHYTDEMSPYQNRRKFVGDWMKTAGVALVVIEDFEEKRDPALRWLTGHPMDALLFLNASGESLLVPWDHILASHMANADTVTAFSAFDRDKAAAIRGAVKHFGIQKGAAIELPAKTAHPEFVRLQKQLDDWTLLCREKGARDVLTKGRAVKDEVEITIYRQVSAITNDLINLIEEKVKNGTLKTEADTALFIEREARSRACEGTGFETLCAGPSRSFGIHCFPSYTNGVFAANGLSILDFGLVYQGYTSDVTMTFARGPLSVRQEEMLSLVEEAAAIGIEAVRPGVRCSAIGKAVNTFFETHGVSMPHNLGHGVGLEAHEAPFLSPKDENLWELEPGMIVTIEPGLYENGAGGCRLENDVLVTAHGSETLTKSRIIRL
jgi:Xaa-Pro dipeptidase